MSDLGAIVLAAGGSSRMGRPKQLLVYQNQTLIRHAVQSAAGAECNPVVVVLAPENPAIENQIADLSIDVAINPNWQSGIGSSIRIGVRRLLELSPDLDALLILLCDQPLINAKLLERLIETYRQSGKEVCACSFAQTIGPPVIAGKRFFSLLMNLPDDRGAKELWLQHPESLCTFACEEAATDIDTSADYQRLSPLPEGERE